MLPHVRTFCVVTYFIEGLLDLLLYFKVVGGHTYTKNTAHANFLQGCYVLDTY